MWLSVWTYVPIRLNNHEENHIIMSIVPAESPVKATFSFAPRVNPGKEGEKYYMMGYVPENHFARCNFEYEEIGGIDVGNLRTSGFTSTKDGVELVPIHSKMEYDHYEDKAKVEAVYLQEVSELLKTHLQMKEVYIFEYLVCYHAPFRPAES